MIIDAHAHLGPAFTTRPAMLPGVTGDEIVALMDGAGIDKACVFAPAWEGPQFIDPDYAIANRAVHDAVKQHPSRLIGVGRVDPNLRGKAVDEMRRCHEEYGFRGLKLHPLWEHFTVNNLGLMDPIMEVCQEYGWPIFCHTGYYPTCQPALFVPLAKRHPGVNIIMFHLGYAHTSDAIIAATLCPNIYLEPSANSTPGAIQSALRRAPIDQFVYGSDLPFTPPLDVIEKINGLPGLSEEQRRKVMGGTIARLVGLDDNEGVNA